MVDIDEIISCCVDDVWTFMNASSSSGLSKHEIKYVICKINSHNNYIYDDFEHVYTKFGKKDTDTMTKDELVEFIKFMNDTVTVMN